MANFLYNPDRKPKQALIAEFVVRTSIYEEIMHDLETSKMKHPEQHYLLVGQRGSGKTTLLNRIKYGIEDSDALKDKVIPILFSEEQYNISELVNLWENIAQYLDDYIGFEGLYEKIEANLQKKNFEELSYDLLEKELKRKGKKLVLLIDNIGDLLKKLEKTEVHRLREILQTKSEIRLIAGSPFYLETVLDYHQPFFEFFKVMRLEGLTQDETEKLLLTLAEMNGEEEKIKKIITEAPGRIETLRTLTGGIPRTIALMYSIFVEYNNEDAVKDLEKILDAVTPLYKHRMDDLPTQQQKIVDAVAKNWDGITVKELRVKLRVDSKIISAQLRQLQKNQVIDTIETGTKNNIYLLKERFLNIWYLMRYGRKSDKQKVIWLVKFLESWCTVNELEQRIIDYVKKVQGGKLDDRLVSFYGEVYTTMQNLRSEMKIILRESTPPQLAKKIIIDNKEILQLANEKFHKQEYEETLKLFKTLSNPDEAASEFVSLHLMSLALKEKELFMNEIKKIFDSKITNQLGDLDLEHFDESMILVLGYMNCIDAIILKDYEGAHKSVDQLLDIAKDCDYVTESTTMLIVRLIFITFITLNQTNIVMNSFEKWPLLKDKIKPVYYATLKILGKHDEFKKLGPELVEKVNEVIALIHESKHNVYSKELNINAN